MVGEQSSGCDREEVDDDGDDALARSLADALEGRVLLPGDAGYDEARQVWNAMVDRRPQLIARCAGTADVAAAVRLARAHDLEIGGALRRAQRARTPASNTLAG
jgi:hypothetical protein